MNRLAQNNCEKHWRPSALTVN